MNIFGQRKKDQEVVKERQEVVVKKLNFKKRKSLYPTNYVLREKGHKKGYLQPFNLDPTRKNKEAITKILNNLLNELRLIWPLDILLNLEELVELKENQTMILPMEEMLWERQ
jgi:hypothetical protein